MDRLARLDPAAPIELPALLATEYPFDGAACIPENGSFKPAHDPITEYADANPGAFAGYADARDQVPQMIHGIRSYLEYHGVRR